LGPADVTPDSLRGVPRIGRGLVSRWRARVPARALRAALWLLGAAVGIASLEPAARADGVLHLGLTDILRVVAGWSFVASGLLAWAQRPHNRTCALMVGVGLLYLLPDAIAPLGAVGATLAVVTGVWWMGLFAVLLVGFPSGRVTARLDRFAVARMGSGEAARTAEDFREAAANIRGKMQHDEDGRRKVLRQAAH
jgi:hypothetical protein